MVVDQLIDWSVVINHDLHKLWSIIIVIQDHWMWHRCLLIVTLFIKQPPKHTNQSYGNCGWLSPSSSLQPSEVRWPLHGAASRFASLVGPRLKSHLCIRCVNCSHGFRWSTTATAHLEESIGRGHSQIDGPWCWSETWDNSTCSQFLLIIQVLRRKFLELHTFTDLFQESWPIHQAKGMGISLFERLALTKAPQFLAIQYRSLVLEFGWFVTWAWAEFGVLNSRTIWKL